MAGVSVDSGGKGGRRSLDSEINMIPMIDLMMCLICFLLITAVWSTMSRLNADAQVPGPPRDTETTPQEPQLMLHVTIQDDKFVLSWRKGGAVDSTVEVPKRGVDFGDGKDAQVRYPELGDKIVAEWKARGSHQNPTDKKMDQAVLHCDNKTPYKELIAVIDAIYQPKREFPGGGAGKVYSSMNVTFSMTSN